MFVYLMVAVLGLTVSVQFYTLHLFAVVTRFETLRNVMRAVTQNSKQLFVIMLFGLTLAYFFGAIIFEFYSESQYVDDGLENQKVCTTLFQCFLHVVLRSPRLAAGIGEINARMSY